MSEIIWGRGDYFIQGDVRIDMDVSAISFSDSAPLTWGYDFEKNPWGVAENIRLVEGELVCDLVFFEPAFKKLFEEIKTQPRGRLGGYYSSVLYDDHGRIVSCRLRSVSVLINGIVPDEEENNGSATDSSDEDVSETDVEDVRGGS